MFVLFPLFVLISVLSAYSNGAPTDIENRTDECSLSNLKKVISSEFTIFGLYANCTIFHMSHDRIDAKTGELSDARSDESSRCRGRQLDLIRRSDGEFQLVVIYRYQYYLQPCPLLKKREDGGSTCEADTSADLRRVATSSNDFNNPVDFKADSNTNIAYQFGYDNDDKPKFVRINMENNTVSTVPTESAENIGQISTMAFDSDGNTLYYKDNIVRNVPVEPTGTINFKSVVDIANVTDVNTIQSMAVSNGYTILKQQTSKGYRYYVQRFATGQKPRCFAETFGNDMDLKLFSRRLPGLLVGIVDLVVLSVPLVRGVYVFVQLKVTNPVAAGWVISVSLLYVLHVICIVLILFGVLFNKPLWMIPKLILKSFTILLCCGFTFTIFYWILSESEHLEDLVLSVIHFQDYASPAKIRFIGIGVLIASIIVTLLQFWLMYILVESYSYVKEMRIRQKVDAMVQKQSSERRDVLYQCNRNLDDYVPNVTLI
ncbi:hypothetical protein QR680_006069 [Steinernema hermaphroditum]|uniref:Intimal thickness related receptor IRP domain-containing protein n=1 Tax=Steinernema hermaphroditum TaxID=289476 RepID=A0AA39HU63_9BILA|nr:hypothetical protein QR680_006069 [Steinernema hermaphroditum]